MRAWKKGVWWIYIFSFFLSQNLAKIANIAQDLTASYTSHTHYESIFYITNFFIRNIFVTTDSTITIYHTHVNNRYWLNLLINDIPHKYITAGVRARVQEKLDSFFPLLNSFVIKENRNFSSGKIQSSETKRFTMTRCWTRKKHGKNCDIFIGL